MLTTERLRELLHYDPGTGVFTRRLDVATNAKAGTVAGCIKAGYVVIGIDRRVYRANRLAWLYMTGEWPKHHIDHKDMDRTNDRWANLREATRSQNGMNRAAYRNNSTGFKGVRKVYKSGWAAIISKDGKATYLGYFKSPEAAHAAYCDAAESLFGDFARAA